MFRSSLIPVAQPCSHRGLRPGYAEPQERLFLSNSKVAEDGFEGRLEVVKLERHLKLACCDTYACHTGSYTSLIQIQGHTGGYRGQIQRTYAEIRPAAPDPGQHLYLSLFSLSVYIYMYISYSLLVTWLYLFSSTFYPLAILHSSGRLSAVRIFCILLSSLPCSVSPDPPVIGP